MWSGLYSLIPTTLFAVLIGLVALVSGQRLLSQATSEATMDRRNCNLGLAVLCSAVSVFMVINAAKLYVVKDTIEHTQVYPSISISMVVVTGLVSVLCALVVFVSIYNRRLIWVAASATILSMMLAVFCDTAFYASYEDAWTLGVMISWGLSVLFAMIFLVLVIVKKAKANSTTTRSEASRAEGPQTDH